jgi:glycosyltransferase involved in cell wall biosynthesis
VINDFSATFPVTLLHVWQPDEGFQLATIRNKAIAKASFEYIIQIDGDLILHQHFIKDHLNLAKPGFFITGSRVLLKPKATSTLLKGESDFLKMNALIGKGSNAFNGLRIGFVRRYLATRYKMKGENKYYVKGCNMSFWRRDLLAVNGYNEAFTGWGKEDSELAIRLVNAGIKKQFIKAGGICYHLYHKEAARNMEQRNTDIMNDAIAKKVTWADKGIETYVSERADSGR